MRDSHDEFSKRDTVVVALAPSGLGNDVDKYLKSKGPVPFSLVSDPKHKVFDDYDVAKKLMSLGQRPALFVLDEQGIVRYNQVGTQQTDIPPIAETLAELDKL